MLGRISNFGGPISVTYKSRPGVTPDPVGSILFTANTTQYLTLPASTDWAVGTGDFQIEWFHYQTNNGNENYIFDLGTADTLAVSLSSGGGNVRLYMLGSLLTSFPNSAAISTWTHIAVSRISGTLRLFQDGNQKVQITNTSNITASQSTLYIACKDPGNPTGDHWPGNISNFRWVSGSASYSGTFSIPTTNLTATANTKLLLKFNTSNTLFTDSSGNNKTVTSFNGPTFSSLSPF